MTVYIVGGFMRSGTTMMMRAVQAGGLPAHVGPSDREQSLMELDRPSSLSPRFPMAFEGKVIKVLRQGILRIQPRSPMDPYKIVFMHRDASAISRSLAAFTGLKLDPDNIGEQIDHIRTQLRKRVDVDVVDMHYEHLLKEPTAAFEYLRYVGWPIEPYEARKIVDPKLRHYR